MQNLPEGDLLRVSVIIPTYNRAIYLREALESVFQQITAPDEVIVVDDGSTDETEAVVLRARGPVRLYRQPHQGIAAARNLGLQMATGDLIAWLDSDDLWEPEFLATVRSALTAHPEWDGVYSGITLIDAAGEVLSQTIRVELVEKLHDRLIEDSFLATPTVVVRKACYDSIGGFDLRFRVAEDYDMWLRLSKRFALAGIPRPLARIRVHGSNTMSDAEALCRARLALAVKHFGALTANICEMPEPARRGHGYALRSIGTTYIASGALERGWEFLHLAVQVYQPILARLDTFYELACGDQPRGCRGQAHLLDIDANGAEMLRRLDELFAGACPAGRAVRRAAYGNAYLALAMLSDQAGDWSLARGYLLRAIAWNPNAVGSNSTVRRFLKLLAGQRVAVAARKLRKPVLPLAYAVTSSENTR